MPRHVRTRALERWTDPERAFLAVAADAPVAVWLDGGAQVTEGRSIVAVAHDGSQLITMDAAAGDALLETLRAGLDEHDAARDDGVPTALGWIGWFGYEWGAARVGIPVAPTEAPDAAFLFVDRAIVFDHSAGTCVEPEWLDAADGDEWAEETAEWMSRAADAPEASDVPESSDAPEASDVPEAADVPVPSDAPAPSDAPDSTKPPAVRWRHAADDYAAMIEACRAAIVRGDAYQLCLTNRVDVDVRPDPVETYLRLRRLSPTHHGGFLRFGDIALLSASPEQFLLAGSDGTLTTKPMKGTRPRGQDAESDAALRAELLASEKERAENVMIVDLMRNDLGRVAVVGTVAVPALHVVEEYAHVHQLVSTVTAQLRPPYTVLDAIAAAFPAGSMTGAPKLSAMSILHGLEQGPRGVYSGAFGRLGVDRSADLAMVIRSILLTPDGASIGTGGGITALSVAEEEVEETRVKARALIEVLVGRPAAAIE